MNARKLGMRLTYVVVGVVLWEVVAAVTNAWLSFLCGKTFLPWPVVLLSAPLLGIFAAMFEHFVIERTVPDPLSGYRHDEASKTRGPASD